MSTLYISEYANMATDQNGHPVAAGVEPALATQVVTYTGTAGLSAALNAATRFVVIHGDAALSYKVGTAPTAVAGTDKRVAAGVDLFFAIDPAKINTALKISAVASA